MKIISTKEYNKLKKTQSAYLDLLMKPLQGVFEKVTDDDLLRENGLLNAENERLNNIINKAIEYIRKREDKFFALHFTGNETNELLDILKGVDKND